MDKPTRQALEIGSANAGEVISFRTKALRRRSQALANRTAAPLASPETAVPETVLSQALRTSAGSAGVLVGEGESWFNYPWTDILRRLEDWRAGRAGGGWCA